MVKQFYPVSSEKWQEFEIEFALSLLTGSIVDVIPRETLHRPLASVPITAHRTEAIALEDLGILLADSIGAEGRLSLTNAVQNNSIPFLVAYGQGKAITK